MSITLELPPHIEALLHQRAEATGQDIQHTALAVLTLKDFDQGHFSSLEAFIVEQNQKHGLALEP
jgi:hypothetical protein